MKYLYEQNILGIMLLIMALSSCSDSVDIRPKVDKFLRLNTTGITINVGEEYLIKPSVDTVAGSTYQLQWSVDDQNLATVENAQEQAGLLKGLKPGTTTIKVESADHKLMYFADLNVREGAPSVKLLTIGDGMANQSANEALIRIASATNKDMVICNMYVNNASLSKHLINIKTNAPVYTYKRIDKSLNINNQLNQKLRDVVSKENWDYIAIEECVDSAGLVNGYNEYLPKVIEYIKSWASNPHLKILIHQPWAYRSDATAHGFITYNYDQLKMFNQITSSINTSKPLTSKIVPIGTAIQNGRTTYLGESVVNGDIDLNARSGQVIAALTWYETLFNVDVSKIDMTIPGTSEYASNLFKQTAHSAVVNSSQITDMVNFKSANSFVLQNPILIDFGENPTPLPFNSFVNPTVPLNNLIDKIGNSTYFNIEATTGFNLLNRREISNVLGFPESVCDDMFFRDGNNPAQSRGAFKVSNMNTTMKYTFIFYGAINDSNTGTHFTVTGINSGAGDLKNDFNTDKVVIINSIQPRKDGTVDIELTKAPFNTHWAGFFGVNAMIIIPDGYQLQF